MKPSEYSVEVEAIISPLKANLMAFVYALPPSAFFIYLYFKIFGKNNILHTSMNNFTFFLLLFAGILLHELLHGIGWSFFTENGFRSVKFGFNLKALTPYAHCKEALKYHHFIVGVALPAVVLGIIPIILAFIFGQSAFLLFGITFLFGAGGDLVVLHLILKNSSDSYIEDHPKKIGCIIYKKRDA